MSEPKSNWLAAAQLGIVSRSFSTIVSQLFAARLGRDAFVDWMTVAEIVAEHGLSFRLPTIAVMGEEPVMREAWGSRVVAPGEVVAFIAVPRGGGDNSTKQIVGLVAALALSIAAPGIGQLGAAAFFGGSSVAAGVISAAFIAGGKINLNLKEFK